MSVALTTPAGVGKASAPVGSREWADHIRLYSLDVVRTRLESPIRLRTVFEVIEKNEAWRLMNKPDGSFFTSLEEFAEHRRPWGWGEKMVAIEPALRLAAGAITREQAIEETFAAAKPAKPVGAPKGNQNRAKAIKGSDTTIEQQPRAADRGASYLAARIKRDAPEIAARAEAGEFPSVRAAAIEAGIVKVATPAEKARKAIAKLPERERNEVILGALYTNGLPPVPHTCAPHTVASVKDWLLRTATDDERRVVRAYASNLTGGQ